MIVRPALWRRLLAEYVGSGLLAAVVIGSGIAAQTLSPHAIGLELLENAAATGLGLYVLIVFGFLLFGIYQATQPKANRAVLDPRLLSSLIAAHPAAPLVFILAQIAASLLFIPRTVLALAADAVAGPPLVAITATRRRTSSAASAGNRSN